MVRLQTNKRSKQGTITKQATLSKQQLETVLKQRFLKQQLLNQHMLNMKCIHAYYGTHPFNAPNACQFKYSSTNNDDCDNYSSNKLDRTAKL